MKTGAKVIKIFKNGQREIQRYTIAGKIYGLFYSSKI